MPSALYARARADRDLLELLRERGDPTFPRYREITCQPSAWDRLRGHDPAEELDLSDWRRWVGEALDRLAAALDWPGGHARARRWRACRRSAARVDRRCLHAHTAPETYVPLRCNLRTCPECARERAGAVAARYARVLEGEVDALTAAERWGSRWRHLTLTRRIPPGERWDPDWLRETVRSTRRLAVQLLRDFWLRPRGRRTNLPGVGATLSVEISPQSRDSEGGAVHVHALVWGPYVAHAELRDYWRYLCGDGSRIVHIREVRGDLRDALAEALKYATKAVDHTGPGPATPPPHLAAIEYALEGTRRLAAYGVFYGRLAAYADDEWSDPLRCEICGAPARPGRILGPGALRARWRRGATWHPTLTHLRDRWAEDPDHPLSPHDLNRRISA